MRQVPDDDPLLPLEDLATGLAPAPGRLLVASPMLVDPHFVRTVVLLLDADGDGALGVVLNRPTETEVAAVLPAWGGVVGDPTVLFEGGPVSRQSALGVGTLRAVSGSGPETRAEPPAARSPVGWRAMFAGCGLVDLDAPVEVVQPALSGLRVYAGYAGWSPGQLEEEVAASGWLVVPALADDLLSTRPGGLWGEVLRRQSGPLAWLASYPADPSAN